MYLYAGMGVVMLTGIMAIFEMGLSLTGQSLLPMPVDSYFADSSIKESDIALLQSLSDEEKLLVNKKTFSELASDPDYGLCGALNQLDVQGWSLIGEGYFINGCQLNRGSRRAIVKENPKNSYQLFSCALSGGSDHCSFEDI
ncbi:hypothetical protein [Synechococcus sp. MU1617]|uniref:hypothetical protein n=1 Tax=Synechococcus sp. MU1617 TaxID=2508346 RepID=UPI001CF8104D|nr:hypothetical protein [Synechococcus sp. MU1617]